MSATRRCPNCGNEMPAGSPGGVCPKCLLSAGFESQSQPPYAATMESPRRGETFVPPVPAELADRFPQLEILELLGRGGMGAVYKARQRGLDRLVALKILPPEVGSNPAFAERFTREARALAKLNHPHVVTVYDSGQVEGLYFFLMEFVDGINLRQAIKSGTFTSQDALAVVPQVCDALQYAHDQGVVHRDIKPENILLDRTGRVKIADFGLAKLLGNESDASLTQTHQVMGTYRYMAPEQMEGTHAVDHRADIYSLGVVFYELLTGELPIGRFAPPSQKVQIDVRLDEVVLRALEKEPNLRYQHVSEVKTDVELINQNLPPEVRMALGRKSEMPARPARPWLVPVIAVLNLLGALLLMFLMSAKDPAPFNENTPYFWHVWGWVQTVIGFALWALVFASSIGLLLWQPWARKLLIVACVVSLVQLVIDVPFLTRALLPHIAADIKSEMQLESKAAGELALDPEVSPEFAFMVMAAFIIVFVLAWLTWTIFQLIYFTRPHVIAAFETSGARSPAEVGSLLTRFPALNKTALVALQVPCVIVYLLCLIMFFSFGASVHTTAEGRVASSFIGQPSPWFTASAAPLRHETQVHLLSGAVGIGILGIASLAAARWLEARQKGRAHYLAWHYAMWALFAAMSLGICMVHQSPGK